MYQSDVYLAFKLKRHVVESSMLQLQVVCCTKKCGIVWSVSRWFFLRPTTRKKSIQQSFMYVCVIVFMSFLPISHSWNFKLQNSNVQWQSCLLFLILSRGVGKMFKRKSRDEGCKIAPHKQTQFWHSLKFQIGDQVKSGMYLEQVNRSKNWC